MKYALAIYGLLLSSTTVFGMDTPDRKNQDQEAARCFVLRGESDWNVVEDTTTKGVSKNDNVVFTQNRYELMRYQKRLQAGISQTKDFEEKQKLIDELDIVREAQNHASNVTESLVPGSDDILKTVTTGLLRFVKNTINDKR